MLDAIIQRLKDSGVYGWELTQTLTEGWEFYFIRHELDQNRAKSTESFTVKIYQKIDDETIGSASAELPPTATIEEAEKLINDLCYRATLVKNRRYALNEPAPGAPVYEKADLRAISGDFMRAVRSLPETAGEDVNSYEIFVSDVTRRLITSTGIDVTERAPSSMLEAVINARREGHEIELYRNIRGGSCDAASVKGTLEKAMAYGRDRLAAKPMPALGKADVLFSAESACELYDYFVTRMDAAMIYRHMSDWEVGKPIAEGITGDRVTVRAVKYLANSSLNAGYDAEGAPIEDCALIEDGVCRRVLGGRMFSQYLGLEKSFAPTNIDVSGGATPEEALREGAYLEAVEFSDFQVDPVTGDIFGEVRLGYWHAPDGTVTPVTGGSVSGSMRDFIPSMRFSAAQAQYDGVRIPALTRLKDVTVTGI